jgi:AhpD family alkylhydroperoxidase
MKLELQTPATAPALAQPLLANVQRSLGFIPNLFATFGNSPAVLGGYLSLSEGFGKSSFTPTEQQIIAITTSAENGCSYCVAAHTTIGGMQKIPAEILTAVRSDEPLANPKWEALRLFTKGIVNQRGWAREEEQEAFLAAGYTATQAMEVVLGVSMKIMSNYIDHLAGTPLDEAFQAKAWSRSETESCSAETCSCAH